MNVSILKKTKTVRTVNWTANITDDNSKTIATMSGVIDSVRPLGTTSLSVVNKTLYNENIDNVKEAYADFQTSIAELAENITTSETETDGDTTIETENGD